MTKKVFLMFALLTVGFASLLAQNLQLHFDPRHSVNGDHFARNYLTATFEMFKADKWGSTYMFVDLDLSAKKGNLGLAYTEVMRDQNLGTLPIKAHLEFNGGLGKDGTFGFSIPNSYLGGASYATRVGAFNLSSYVAYKYNAFNRGSHDMQWTGIWGANFCDDKLTFSGFVDIWSENKRREKEETGISGKKIILLTEPQLWYNATSNLSVGTEVEISSNFCNSRKTLRTNRVFVNPTLAVKWNF